MFSSLRVDVGQHERLCGTRKFHIARRFTQAVSNPDSHSRSPQCRTYNRPPSMASAFSAWLPPRASSECPITKHIVRSSISLRLRLPIHYFRYSLLKIREKSCASVDISQLGSHKNTWFRRNMLVTLSCVQVTGHGKRNTRACCVVDCCHMASSNLGQVRSVTQNVAYGTF